MLAALRGAEWAHMRDYVSGAFFEVLPAGDVASELARLSRNAARRRAFESRRDELAGEWAEQRPRVVPTSLLDVDSLAEQASVDGVTRLVTGHAVLSAFFRIALGGGDVLLDLRPTRFAWTGDELHWSPGRLWTTWDADFSAHVAGLYRGFYRDDEALFEASVEGLGLLPARETLRRHFGGDDQRAVAFDLETFHATFHEVFVSCRDSGARLHRGFVTLGLLLACLYETLELLGGTYDVRAAFDQLAGS